MFSPVDISASNDHSNPPKNRVHENIIEYLFLVLIISHQFPYFSIAATWDFPSFPSFPSLAIWPKSPVRTCGWFWCMHPSGIARCRQRRPGFLFGRPLESRQYNTSIIYLYVSIYLYIYIHIIIYIYMYVRTVCIYILYIYDFICMYDLYEG